MGAQSTESRNKTVLSFTDPVSSSLLLEMRTPYGYRDDSTNIAHRAVEGDTWWTIAARYYRSISSRASGLWWAVKDYQPTPVTDPTLSIRPGALIIVMSPLKLVSEVLGVERSLYQ